MKTLTLNYLKSIISNKRKKGYFSSRNYWENRYVKGGTSGAGSYGDLANFKAKIVTGLLKEYQIQSVVEFGCGDGNQLGLIPYPSYIGLDVSKTIIGKCKELYVNDKSKSFFLYDHECFEDKHGIFEADMSISLDVIYHLIEDEIYFSYLKHLFQSGSKLVVIYSSNINIDKFNQHEHHRKFSDDVDSLFKNWSLAKVIENEFPSTEYSDDSNSLARFYIYSKK